MRFLITTLLLAAIFAFTIASPVPAASLDEIEKRWSEGESEVCQPGLAGCYISAWIGSLTRASKRASIHATHNYRDATPAWPVVRNAVELSWDERTSETRLQKREPKEKVSLARLRQFVKDFNRKMEQKGANAGRKYQKVEDAPKLQPRRTFRYRWAA